MASASAAAVWAAVRSEGGSSLAHSQAEADRSVKTVDLLKALGSSTGEELHQQPRGGPMWGPQRRGGATTTHKGVSSSTFEECSAKAHQTVRKAAIGSNSSLLQRVDVETIVNESITRMRGCTMMVLTLVFFIVYAASSHLHEEITRGYLTQIPLRDRLSEGLEDVLTIRDVWTWIEDVYIPTFFRQTDMYGDPLPPNDWGRVLNYAHLEGAVLLSQVRSPRRPCTDPMAAHLLCYPQGEFSQEPFGRPVSSLPASVNRSVVFSEEEGFTVSSRNGRRLRMRREEIMRWLPSGGSAEDTFTFYLHRRSPLEEIRQRVQYLRARRWLDEQSMQLVLKAIVLNAEHGRPKLENVQVTFYFSRGGGVFSALHFQSAHLRPWSGALSVGVDILFVLTLVLFTAFMFREMVLAARHAHVCAHFFNLANFLAWVNVGLSWVNVGFFLIQNTMRNEVLDMLYELHNAEGNAAETARVSEELHEVTDKMLVFSSWFHTLSTYMVLLLMARSFITLEFQPRLAIVLKTLKVSSIDLAHFLVIIIPTFVAYGIAGMCLFGRRVDEFSSIERAIGTCFKIAIESEFDWVKLSAEDPMTTASWVWTYVLLIVMIMLNMVLAIIMDVYTEVRSNDSRSETIWESAVFVGQRIRWWRQWVPGEQVLEVLEGMPNVFTVDELQQAVPDMPGWQASWLTSAARSKVENVGHSWQDDQFRVQMLAAMNVGSDMAHKSLERILAKRSGEAAATAAESHPDRRTDETCYEDIVQSMAVQSHWMMTVQEQLDRIRTLQRAAPATAASV